MSLISISSQISLFYPSSESLELLDKACDPATFGRNKEDIYDESYRKARKLDVGSFMIGLDIVRLGLIKIIRENLVLGEEAAKPVRAELYNLNVYGGILYILWEIVFLTIRFQGKDPSSRHMSILPVAQTCSVHSSSYFLPHSTVASLS